MRKLSPLLLYRLLRFGGGLALVAVATQYKDAWALYGFGGIMFLTGFIRPKRCIDGCEFDPQANTYADENKK